MTVIQFLKGRSWNQAEASIAVQNGVHWPVFSPGLTWGRRDPRELCLEAWSAARTALESPAGGLVILDEISRAADTVIRFDLLKHDERLGKPMTH